MRTRGGHHGLGSVAPKTSPRLNHQGDLDPINSNEEYSLESTSLEALTDKNELSDNEEHHHHPLIGWLHRWIRYSGFRPVFLFEKEVTKTDTVKRSSRLLIPQAVALQKILPLLTEKEKYLAMEENSGLTVRAIDQMGRKWRLSFKAWVRGSDKKRMYVFYHQDWLEMIRKNNLAEGNWVRVWAFRYDPPNNKLCFVIGVKRPETITVLSAQGEY